MLARSLEAAFAESGPQERISKDRFSEDGLSR